MQGQVTIITPVFNGEKYIFRLLDSLLMQTYPYICMYVIDDGSTDNTKTIIDNYIPKFKKRGYSLRYVHQEKGGQSAALNRGLKYVEGDYLLWPDADDWYKTPDAIEIMVNAIRSTDDTVGIARCQLEFINENTGGGIKTTLFAPCDTPFDLLEDAIYGTNGFLYAPIEWIVKTKYLDVFIPKREIYTRERAGQNAQILLPYLGYSKCVTIDKILCCYLVRENSSCHEKRTYELSVDYDEGHLNAFVETLLKMDKLDAEKRAEYIMARQFYYYSHILNFDYEFENTVGFRKHYKHYSNSQIKLSKRWHRLWIWTTFFSIKSYKYIQKLIHHQ